MKIPAIEFINFGFHYRAQEQPTLKNINLTIQTGEKILIAGPSGSGKSTVAHCINGLVPHYYKGEISGELRINGVDARSLSLFDKSKQIGTVLQDSDGQFVGQTVAEDIAFALENDCIPQAEMILRVADVSRIVDIHRHLASAPQEISGGQKQRVSLAGVLVDDVDILLFDEPLANLDPATGQYAIELIDELIRSTGKTAIIIEHRLEDVLWRDIDRIILMNDGEIVADQSPDDLLASGLLRQYGIREPLYVTALSYAGVPLKPQLRLGSLSRIDFGSLNRPLNDWYQRAEAPSVIKPDKPILTFQNICFSYDQDRHVLCGIDFEIQRGEMTAIVGKNGAGKSTLCKLACGFERPQSGRILFDGKDVTDDTIRERANTVGYVMQNPNQMISKVMIREEVEQGLKLRGVDPEMIDRRVDETLRICGLYPFRNWPISALSYGQKKRVTIAAILALEPRIILLDEPTAGQDLRHYTEFMEFLQTLQQRGLTILLVTHDMHLMLEYTRRVIVLTEGEMICDDSPARVLTDPKIIEAANLKETSLLKLAQKTAIPDPLQFVQRFIEYDRKKRKTWQP